MKKLFIVYLLFCIGVMLNGCCVKSFSLSPEITTVKNPDGQREPVYKGTTTMTFDQCPSDLFKVKFEELNKRIDKLNIMLVENKITKDVYNAEMGEINKIRNDIFASAAPSTQGVLPYKDLNKSLNKDIKGVSGGSDFSDQVGSDFSDHVLISVEKFSTGQELILKKMDAVISRIDSLQ